MFNVTVVGVFRTDVPNTLEHLVRSFGAHTDQRWRSASGPKFPVINQMLRGTGEYLIVCDDDITLPPHFLDRYLTYVQRHDLALAQPARSRESTFDHPITLHQPGDVRLTRFVEIGPLFSIRRDLFDALLPFDETSPMGWGYDLVWPVIVKHHGLRMGIVDATPVQHTMRTIKSYNVAVQQAAMADYLSRHEHLSYEEACAEEIR